MRTSSFSFSRDFYRRVVKAPFSATTPGLPPVRIFYANNRVSQVDYGKATAFYAYDFGVGRTTQVDRGGSLSEFEHDYSVSPFDGRQKLDLLRQTVYSRGLRQGFAAEPTEYTTEYIYDPNHEVVEIKKPRENVTRLIRDIDGDVVQIIQRHSRTATYPALTTEFEYEPVFKRLVRVTEPRGNVDDPSDPRRLVSMDMEEQIPGVSGNTFAQKRRFLPLSAQAAGQRDAFSTYTFYDHEDVPAVLATRQSDMDVSGQWSLSRPLLKTYGRPNGSGPVDSLVFRDIDMDGRLDRGGNVYVIRGPRPKDVVRDGTDPRKWSHVSAQTAEMSFTYNYYGQNILLYEPDDDPGPGDGGRRTRSVWNVANFHPVTNPDAGYLLMTEVATGYKHDDFSAADLGPSPGDQTRGGVPTAGPSDPNGLNLQTRYVHNSVGATIRTTDPGGHSWSRTVDALNLIVEERGPAPFNYATKHAFSSSNNRIRVQVDNSVPDDHNDNGLQDGVGEQRSLGVFTHFRHFNSVNEITSTDLDATGSKPSRLVTTLERDGKQRVVAVREPEGNVHRTVFDERDLVVSKTFGETDPRTAQTVRFLFDKNENLESVFNDIVDATGNRTFRTTTFDLFDRAKVFIDELGERTEVEHDAASNVIEARRVGRVTGATGETPTTLLARSFCQFDEAGRAFQSDTEFFDEISRAPHAAGALTPPIDITVGPAAVTLTPGLVAANLVQRVTVHLPDGKVVNVVDDNGNAVAFDYDVADRNTVVTDQLGSKLIRHFNEDSLVIRTEEVDVPSAGTNPIETRYNEFFFDEEHRATQHVTHLGNTKRWLHDSRHNVVQVSDAMGAPSGMTLGSLRPSAPTAGVVLNARGNTTRFVFDGASRLLETHRDLRSDGTGTTPITRSIVTKSAWDGNSRIIERTDDNQNVTKYCFDDQNRLFRTSYADGTRRELVWVDLSNPARQDRQSTVKLEIDGRDVAKRYSYDAKRRRTGLSVSANPPGLPALQTTQGSWQWDGADRLTAASDDDSLVTQTFDSLGNRRSQTQYVDTETAGRLGFRTTSAFDGEGRRTSIGYPEQLDVNGVVLTARALTVDQQFDDVDRLRQISDGSPQPIATYQHIGMDARLLSRTTGPSATTLQIEYDGNRRPIVWEHMLGASAFKRFEYTWDRANNRRSEKDWNAGIGNFYVYDSAYRLVTDIRNLPSASLPQYNSAGFTNQASLAIPAGGNRTTYVLDGANNRTSVSVDGVSTSYTRNTFSSPPVSHEPPPPGAVLSDAATNQYSNVGGALLTHDRNGNQTSGGELGQQRYFDCDDQLIQATSSGQDARYRYDALGRRLSKSYLDSGGVRREVVFARDGWETLEEWTPGAVVGAASRAKRFVYGEAVDEPLRMSVIVGGVVTANYWYHQNSIGSVVAITNDLGTVVEQYRYSAYGELLVIQDATGSPIPETAIGQPFYFQGRRRDFEEAATPSSALMYFRARYYDPKLGRFISRDPKGVWGDAGQMGNAQSAFGNNPVNRIDPFGLDDGESTTTIFTGPMNKPKYVIRKSDGEDYENGWIDGRKIRDISPLHDSKNRDEKDVVRLTLPNEIWDALAVALKPVLSLPCDPRNAGIRNMIVAAYLQLDKISLDEVYTRMASNVYQLSKNDSSAGARAVEGLSEGARKAYDALVARVKAGTAKKVGDPGVTDGTKTTFDSELYGEAPSALQADTEIHECVHRGQKGKAFRRAESEAEAYAAGLDYLKLLERAVKARKVK